LPIRRAAISCPIPSNSSRYRTPPLPPDIFTPTLNPATLSFDPSGFIGGGQFGCNYQFAQEWVAGIEVDLDAADVQGSRITGQPNPPAGTTIETTYHVKSTWLASTSARFGYAPGPWLFYVKGGAAWMPDKFSIVSTKTVTDAGPPVTTTLTLDTWTASGTRTGFTFGGGIEGAFLTYWSARIDYGFYYFGNRNVAFAGPNSALENIKQWMSVITVGVSYRFGPGPVSYYY
jgi:outer membrane immunogenic protein